MKRIIFISVMMIAVILATHRTYIKGEEYRESTSEQVTYPVKEFEGDYEQFLKDIHEERKNQDVKNEQDSDGDDGQTAVAIGDDGYKVRHDLEHFDVNLVGDREAEQTIEESEPPAGDSYDGYSETENGVEGATDEAGESWDESSWDNDQSDQPGTVVGSEAEYSVYGFDGDSGSGLYSEDEYNEADSWTEPEPELVEYGEPEQDSSGLIYLGEWTSTAYCACELCCGQWASGYTASGTLATEGRTVACGAYPFGTQLMIDGHIYTVEDRGVDGEWVDIFFYDHAAASAYGLRTVSVYLVG